MVLRVSVLLVLLSAVAVEMGSIGVGPIGPPGCRYWCTRPDKEAYCCLRDDAPIIPTVEHPGSCPPIPDTCSSPDPHREVCPHDGYCKSSEKCCFYRCYNRHACSPV